MSACGAEVETTGHFLLTCHLHSTQRSEFSNKGQKVDPNFIHF